HLRETIALYEKVLTFNAAVSKLIGSVNGDDVAYPAAVVGTIIGSFSSTFAVPEDRLVPLREALICRQIDFTRLPLNEIPAFSLPYHEDDLALMLFLISRPYFIRWGESYHHTGKTWERGRCPVCTAKPSLASIDSENRRKLYCSFCGTKGHYRRLGCPVCLNEDAAATTLFTFENESGFRVDACDRCGSYVKTVVNESMIESTLSPDLADLVSLPLDIRAQGKGYRRHSPNAVGMTRIV
ncbi:MAG: formate dehydrogenase accessory protein FdhE, partial [Thermodesulfovibrionales bacterium]